MNSYRWDVSVNTSIIGALGLLAILFFRNCYYYSERLEVVRECIAKTSDVYDCSSID